MSIDLSRFVEAQERDYECALGEIRQGRKRSHWMWYIFPQLGGLGHSAMAERYAIRDLEEAKAYLADPTLGRRLVEISLALLALPTSDATAVMGTPDELKLRSCMTLFCLVPGADAVFMEVLRKYYGGRKDEWTVRLVKG